MRDVAQPLFSLILCTYNAGISLERCFSSIKEQDCDDYEVIVQDNVSTDGTTDILRQWERKIPLHWRSEPDSGIYNAWNKAVEHANGRWFLFLGADDKLLTPHALSQFRERMTSLAPSVQYVGGALLLGEKDTPISTWLPPRHDNVMPSMRKVMTLRHQALLHRRDLFDKEKFDETFKISADYDFVLRTLRNDNFVVAGDILAVYKEEGGISRMLEYRDILFRERYRVHKKNGLNPRKWDFDKLLLRWKMWKLLCPLIGRDLSTFWYERGLVPLLRRVTAG